MNIDILDSLQRLYPDKIQHITDFWTQSLVYGQPVDWDNLVAVHFKSFLLCTVTQLPKHYSVYYNLGIILRDYLHRQCLVETDVVNRELFSFFYSSRAYVGGLSMYRIHGLTNRFSVGYDPVHLKPFLIQGNL